MSVGSRDTVERCGQGERHTWKSTADAFDTGFIEKDFEAVPLLLECQNFKWCRVVCDYSKWGPVSFGGRSKK